MADTGVSLSHPHIPGLGAFSPSGKEEGCGLQFVTLSSPGLATAVYTCLLQSEGEMGARVADLEKLPSLFPTPATDSQGRDEGHWGACLFEAGKEC